MLASLHWEVLMDRRLLARSLLAAGAFASLLFAARSAYAWGRWMGEVTGCPAPEKQSFMNSVRKDSPYCSLWGKCGAGWYRVELIDLAGFDFSVCVKEGVQPFLVAMKVVCAGPERLAYR